MESHKRSRKLSAAAIVTALLFLAAVLSISVIRSSQEKNIVLKVDGEEVSAGEAMIYYRLMQMKFEEIAGEDVWSLDMLGFDPEQTTEDRVLESIVRIKVVQPLAGEVRSSELPALMEYADRLEALLGSSFMDENDIDRELIEKVLTENYLASRYEETAVFRSSDFEEQIREQTEEAYGNYDSLDQEEYLKTVTLIPMMFYTGQYTEGVWVSYPETQKEQIYKTAQTVCELTTPENFYRMAIGFSDSADLTDNPVFSYGVVQNTRMSGGTAYMGQILPEAAEIILNTEVGQMTPLMTTEYGYLVCLVTKFNDPYPSDYSSYSTQLLVSRSQFRASLIDTLKQQRMEEEWERLEEESDVERFEGRFGEYLDSHPVS